MTINAHSPKRQVLSRVRVFVAQQMLLKGVFVLERLQTQIAGVRGWFVAFVSLVSVEVAPVFVCLVARVANMGAST